MFLPVAVCLDDFGCMRSRGLDVAVNAKQLTAEVIDAVPGTT